MRALSGANKEFLIGSEWDPNTADKAPMLDDVVSEPSLGEQHNHGERQQTHDNKLPPGMPPN